MPSIISPTRWWRTLKREWLIYHLGLPEFRFMFDKPPPNEWVSLDCETTGLNVGTDEIISIGAVRIVGNKIMTSERFEVLVRPERGVSPDSVRIHRLRGQDVAQGLPTDEAMKQLMRFIGSRPLVGYFLEFDVAMLNRAIWPLLGQGLPQPKIEVSAMYYDYKFRQMLPYEQQTNPNIDLRFTKLMSDLDLPVREAHDALNDAVMAAMAFIKLRQLKGARGFNFPSLGARGEVGEHGLHRCATNGAVFACLTSLSLVINSPFLPVSVLGSVCVRLWAVATSLRTNSFYSTKV